MGPKSHEYREELSSGQMGKTGGREQDQRSGQGLLKGNELRLHDEHGDRGPSGEYLKMGYRTGRAAAEI